MGDSQAPLGSDPDTILPPFFFFLSSLSVPTRADRKNEWTRSDCQQPSASSSAAGGGGGEKIQNLRPAIKPDAIFSPPFFCRCCCCCCHAHLFGIVSKRKSSTNTRPRFPRFRCELRGLGGSNNRRRGS